MRAGFGFFVLLCVSVFGVFVQGLPGFFGVCVACGFLVVALVVALCFGFGWVRVWVVLLRFVWFFVPLLVFHCLQGDCFRGVRVGVVLLALIVFAGVFSFVVSVSECLDFLSVVLRPLAWFGVNSVAVALAFALVVRMLPRFWEIAEDARQAARARGVERSVRARVVPLVVRGVDHALCTGEAVCARRLLRPNDFGYDDCCSGD